MSKAFILIGNGSSIGIVNSINAYRKSIGQSTLNISLTNLFLYGDSFYYPMTDTPFLTPEHCPNLWALGARPGMASAEANIIISKIMTCSNVYALMQDEGKQNCHGFNPLYSAAYAEFTSYLRYLMIFYNDQITDDDLSNISVSLLSYLANNYDEFDKITFISYNYDILLERLLALNGFPMTIGCFQPDDTKVVVYKPHGSISFSYKQRYPLGCPYEIPYNELCYQSQMGLDDFDLTYQFTGDYPVHNGMIPPYGEAERYEICYYVQIRNAILRAVGTSAPGDIYIIVGSAYGTFDRSELDKVNIAFNTCTNVTYINPDPNIFFEAVLQSLFPIYQQLPYF